MKMRNGFVSNSSSSSFIIGMKGNLTKDKLLDIFNVPKDSVIYPLVKELSSVIIEKAEKESVEEYMDDLGYDDEDELPEVSDEFKRMSEEAGKHAALLSSIEP